MWDAVRSIVRDAFIQIVVAVVAAVWALPRIQQWRQGVKDGRWWRLEQLAENAVVQTWNAYVAGLKAADGAKLTPEQASKARQTAVAALTDLAAQELPGVVAQYGQSVLEALVAQVHARFQKEGAVG